MFGTFPAFSNLSHNPPALYIWFYFSVQTQLFQLRMDSTFNLSEKTQNTMEEYYGILSVHSNTTWYVHEQIQVWKTRSRLFMNNDQITVASNVH